MEEERFLLYFRREEVGGCGGGVRAGEEGVGGVCGRVGGGWRTGRCGCHVGVVTDGLQVI